MRAYAYELATAIDSDNNYFGWKRHLSFDKPNVPDGSIRNLVVLESISSSAANVGDSSGAAESVMHGCGTDSKAGDVVVTVLKDLINSLWLWNGQASAGLDVSCLAGLRDELDSAIRQASISGREKIASDNDVRAWESDFYEAAQRFRQSVSHKERDYAALLTIARGAGRFPPLSDKQRVAFKAAIRVLGKENPNARTLEEWYDAATQQGK